MGWQTAANLSRRIARKQASVTRGTSHGLDPQARRPDVTERLPILREALSNTLEDLGPADALLRGLLLLTSPTSLLYWQDYLDITVDEAAETASRLIRRLAKP